MGNFFMYFIASLGIIWGLFIIVLYVYELIYEFNHKEELNMNFYDEKNNCFVPNPPAMRYWEIITKISDYKNISLKEAAKAFYDLSGVPSMEILEIILNSNENDLIPFKSEVYAGRIAHITNIVIDDEHDENDKDDKTRNRIYYLLDIDDSLYSCEVLQRID